MVHTFIHSCSFLENHTQFPVEDTEEGPAPPDFYAKIFFFGDRTPLPLSKGLDDRAPPYLKDWIWHWFQTKMGKIYTRLRLKRRKNPTLWGGTYPYGLYKGVLPRGWVHGLSLHKIFVCIHMVVRLSSCGTSSQGHYTSFTTRRRVMCCLPLIFKPSLWRREKLPQKVGRKEKLAEKVRRREIYRPVPLPSKKCVIDV